jgi:hypothetical protein
LKTYPFDPSIKHHFLIALGLATWIFVFLYFTEPLDVNEFSDQDKLIYLPLYGLLGAVCYLGSLPLQFVMFRKKHQWTLQSELVVSLAVMTISFVIARSFFLYIIVAGQDNPYTLGYYTTSIFLPAIVTIFPIVFMGRWAFGKYKDKKLEDQKIEILGVGNYESLRLFWNDLICVQSSDNYVEVTYQNSGVIKKHLIRNKLSVIETDFPELLRTHRSFLVNPYHFRSWKTENSKLYLVLSNDELAPISKTYTTAVKSVINSATN